MACTVRRHIVAKSVEVLSTALYKAFHCSLQSGKNLKKFPSGLNGGIDEGFRAQLEAMRFLQEAEWEARDDAESVLAVNAASWKGDGNGLVHAAALQQIGKVDRLFKERSGRRIFGGHGFDAQGKGR